MYRLINERKIIIMEKQDNEQKKRDAIYTDTMVIRDNIMEWGNTMIQLSNVCSISTYTYIKAEPFPTNSLILGGIGLVALFFNVFIGILLLIMAGVWIFMWKKKSNNPDKTMTLDIMMNSGSIFNLVFYDENFKLKVLRVLESIISKGNNYQIGDINIDIKNNKIQGDLSFMNRGN